MDTKIASKVIAERIKKRLPEIIHNNESGYITGRYIGENIHSILDIMDYTKANNLPGFLCLLTLRKPLIAWSGPFSIDVWNYFILGQVLL